MRANRLKVFDGLRVTTEHINHLQTAFRSGIEDLREAAGLGAVQHGFDVSVANGQVTVAPGIAFDRQRNRIVSDDPQSLPVSFVPGQDAQYVCVSYQTVETGPVEGQPTLVFDSCNVSLQPSAPGPKDNAIAIAKLVNTPGGIDVMTVVDVEPADTKSAVASAPAGIRAQQGVLRLTGSPVEVQFADLPNTLATAPIDLDFVPASITARVLVTASLTLQPPLAAPSVEPAPPSDGGPVSPDAQPFPPAAQPPPEQPARGSSSSTVYRFEGRADAEASIEPGRVTQYALTTSPSIDVSEHDLGRLFLDVPDAAGLDAIRSGYVALRLTRPSGEPITVTCVLDWTGPLGDAGISAIRDRKPSLSWQALVAWKAIGVSGSQ